MEGQNRPASANVTCPAEDQEKQIFHNICSWNFFALAELLHRQHSDRNEKADISLRKDPAAEVVRFYANAQITFPGSDIQNLTKNPAGQYLMTTTFMGLSGSQSPLPGYYLDNLAWSAAQEEGHVVDFLNMFSHRWTQFIHHIWRKYRYHICFRNGGSDAFSQRMYALVGLGSQRVRDKLAINHSKMLAYAGVMATPGRSPEVICSLVSHCFDLPDITLENWQLRKVDISPRDQNRLGYYRDKQGNLVSGNSCPGLNFTLGARVPDRSGKFLLCINNLSRERFLSFLPSGENFLPLTMFVAFILRDQFAWDLRLGLAPDQADSMRLGDEKSSMLGWTSFVGKPEQQPFITINVRN
ncbi:type VI secretion system baseplate subunit TssG [Salmonella enterica]|nr:type VI secretion system baseplate subunit TssG [Salmonella enterica]ECI4153138.1 type VI secretion system baseplate subunit TssG [Salmonella enterica subsp. salamae]HCM1853070.1 type VI secretion system baseplate subunit TssG [Salmonella enterica subsp. salamae serovar 42:z29:-]EAU0241706.1 type VI secretion system baseplate subunit TssG [Salmonella enterica]EAX3604110.1 type VI secretion system baseplate subunit TssG [Salmonella enterica]